MEIPFELFKYRNFEKYTILSLINKSIWIPKPSQLNDPFDAQFKISRVDVSMEQFIQAFSDFQSWFKEKNKAEIQYQGFEQLFENDKPNLHLSEQVNRFRSFWDEKSESMGVLSLSETPDSTTMWSHYADNHSGICIGYDPRKLFINSPYAALDWLRKVDYLAENEIIRNAYLLYAKTGMCHTSETMVEILFKMLAVKSKDWCYEKEWRFILPDKGGNIFNLEIDAISSITFGLKTPAETKSTISHILRYHEKKTKFYQAVRCANTIGLTRVGMNSESEYWGKPYE